MTQPKRPADPNAPQPGQPQSAGLKDVPQFELLTEEEFKARKKGRKG